MFIKDVFRRGNNSKSLFQHILFQKNNQRDSFRSKDHVHQLPLAQLVQNTARMSVEALVRSKGQAMKLCATDYNLHAGTFSQLILRCCKRQEFTVIWYEYPQCSNNP